MGEGTMNITTVGLVAVPSGSISDALDNVSGLEGKIAVDATNACGPDSARAIEDFAVSVFAKLQPASFYRFAPPGELQL